MNSVSTQRMLERKARHVNARFAKTLDTLGSHARNAKAIGSSRPASGVSVCVDRAENSKSGR